MITDTERLDWLEKEFGCALVNDDNGHWAVSYTGVQNVQTSEESEGIYTSFFVEKDEWYPSAREAIDAAMNGQSGAS